MKVTSAGIHITEVPGIDLITVEPNAHSQYGVRITLSSGLASTGGQPVSYGLDELEDTIAALTRAAEEARSMADYSLNP